MNDLNFPGWQPEKSIEVVTGEGMTRVFIKGQPYMSWQSADEGCLRLAIVQLHACGLATEEELASAFGRHTNSVQRYLAEFAAEGMRGLVSERRGPKGPWKMTPEMRGKIWFIVLREGVCKLEAIQQRVAEVWQEAVSVPSIQQVLEENGLSEPMANSLDGAGVQGELFDAERERQLVLNLNPGANPLGEPSLGGSGSQKEAAARQGLGWGDQAGVQQTGRGSRRDYSPAQRVYLDQLEQGAYNAYAGGLLFAPLLAHYGFVPTLRKIITLPT
jgi:transposase